MSDKHTPLPWRNIHGHVISEAMPRDGSHTICRVTIINNNLDQAYANADLIVRSVNAFGDLPEVLANVRKSIELVKAMAGDYCPIELHKACQALTHMIEDGGHE